MWRVQQFSVFYLYAKSWKLYNILFKLFLSQSWQSQPDYLCEFGGNRRIWNFSLHRQHIYSSTSDKYYGNVLPTIITYWLFTRIRGSIFIRRFFSQSTLLKQAGRSSCHHWLNNIREVSKFLAFLINILVVSTFWAYRFFFRKKIRPNYIAISRIHHKRFPAFSASCNYFHAMY